MAEKKVQCPHCNEVFKLDLPEAQPQDLQPATKQDIEEILSKSTPSLDHRHGTADEFLDCPECRQWFDKTAVRYQVATKEPEPPPPPPPPPEEKPADQTGKKEPEPAATGSIFSTKSGEE